MITTVIATLALAWTAQDRVSIVHDFQSEIPLAYTLTFNAKLADGDSISKAQIKIKSLRSLQNGNTDIELHMNDVKFVEGEVEHTFKSVVFGFTVTKNGVPVDAVFDSIESMASASLIALFLPAKQMAEGETFNYKYDGDLLGLKFKVIRQGSEKRNDLELIRISTTGTISPAGKAVADFNLTTLYDPVGKRVAEAHATIQLPWGDIVIDLVAAD